MLKCEWYLLINILKLEAGIFFDKEKLTNWGEDLLNVFARTKPSPFNLRMQR